MAYIKPPAFFLQQFGGKHCSAILATQKWRFARQGTIADYLKIWLCKLISTTSSLISAPVVTPTSYLTLHYRIGTGNNAGILSTFDQNPATLQLGAGQLALALEQCLIGLHEGAHQIFALPPEKAYGPRNPVLLQHVSLRTLRENSVADADYVVGDLLEFNAPSGERFAGMLCGIGSESVLFDFNHPLAGQNIVFEVRIIGIL